MAVFTFLATLSACLLLGHQAIIINNAPCQPSKSTTGYDTFFKRHIRSGTPTSFDKKEWEKYIREHGGCDRPTQSFLNLKDLPKVKAVCANGGSAFKDNMCVSKRPFRFVTVRSEMGTCGIKNVSEEIKHLILACEVLDNQCLPVHFEGNPGNSRPSSNAHGCEDPRASATSIQMTSVWIVASLLIAYCFN